MRILATIVTALLALLALSTAAHAVVLEPTTVAEGSDRDVRDTDNVWTTFDFLNVDDDLLIGYGGSVGSGEVQLIHNRLRFEVPDATEPGWEFRATAAGANLIEVSEDFDIFNQSVDVWAETNLDREGLDDGLLDSIADYAVALRNSGQLFKDEDETDPWPSIGFVGSSTVSVEGSLVVDLTSQFNDAILAGADWFEITMTPGWRAFPSGDPATRTGQAAFFFEEPSPFPLFASAVSGTQIVIGDPSNISLPEIVSIPEPATLALFGLGGVVMLARRRHR